MPDSGTFSAVNNDFCIQVTGSLAESLVLKVSVKIMVETAKDIEKKEGLGFKFQDGNPRRTAHSQATSG